jgi:hypothetical protein
VATHAAALRARELVQTPFAPEVMWKMRQGTILNQPYSAKWPDMVGLILAEQT